MRGLWKLAVLAVGIGRVMRGSFRHPKILLRIGATYSQEVSDLCKFLSRQWKRVIGMILVVARGIARFRGISRALFQNAIVRMIRLYLLLVQGIFNGIRHIGKEATLLNLTATQRVSAALFGR